MQLHPLLTVLYVFAISSDNDDDEEEFLTPTFETRVIVVGTKISYSLFDESDSGEE